MLFNRGDKTAERDWECGQIVDQREHDALCAELGGEPEGDYALLSCGWPEGSESTTPGKWRVSGPEGP